MKAQSTYITQKNTLEIEHSIFLQLSLLSRRFIHEICKLLDDIETLKTLHNQTTEQFEEKKDEPMEDLMVLIGKLKLFLEKFFCNIFFLFFLQKNKLVKVSKDWDKKIGPNGQETKVASLDHLVARLTDDSTYG